MTLADISYTQFIIGMLLLLLPFVLFYVYKIKLAASAIVSVARMTLQLILAGLYLDYLFVLDSAWVNIMWFILMVFVASFVSVSRIHLPLRLIFVPVAAGLLLSTIAVTLFFLIFVVQIKNPFDSQYFIPVTAMLIGNTLMVNVVAVSTYFAELMRNSNLYYYLLGNGATRKEAILPFLRKAVDKSVVPSIASMAMMGIVSFPGIMLGQMISGTTPGNAVKYQILLIVMAFSAAILSLFITLKMADASAFDKYGRLRKIR